MGVLFQQKNYLKIFGARNSLKATTTLSWPILLAYGKKCTNRRASQSISKLFGGWVTPLSKAKNTESREMHKRLALKITVKFLALVLVFEVALILLGLLFLVIMGATNLDRTVWFEALKPFLIPLLIVLSVAGCGYISYRFMLRPLEHLDEVAEAAKQLAHPTDAPILLSHDLKSIEDDLNLVREQTLNSIKDAREADVRKDDLLVYLAHDLKTPLTSVLGYLKLMEDEPEIDPALIKKYSGIAGRKAERLESLINEFFEITRFSTHKLSLEPAKTNLSRMLMQITYEFHPILTEKNLEWDLQIPENIEIVCDRDKLERAIDNLIRNAINYSYAGTTIFFSLTQLDEQVRICVQNKGQTIPPEKLERIFEQFYRLDAARSSDTGGAGLGLAIAKEIIELHHGTISAHSESETIQFLVQLPLDCQKNVRSSSERNH